MFGVSADNLSPALYLQIVIPPFRFVAQPISFTPFQIIAVKWPVALPATPSAQPSLNAVGPPLQSFTSEYQAFTESATVAFAEVQYRFSPAGPAGGTSL